MRKIALFIVLAGFICLKLVAGDEVTTPRSEDPFYKLFEMTEKTLEYPESVIINEDLKDFCDNTLAPMLRTMEFDNYINALFMDIKPRSYGNYDIKVNIVSSGLLDKKRTASGTVTFCLVDSFFLRIEAPADCPLIEVKANELTLDRLEGNMGISDCPEWRFHTEGNALILEEVIFAIPGQVYEGKVLNFRTGRLVKPESANNVKTPTIYPHRRIDYLD